MNELRRERNRELFISITCDLIEKEGMEAATIRNIANKAGYNSATLYSYFDNQAHVLFSAFMKFEDELFEIMKQEVEQSNQEIFAVWSHIYVVMARYYFEHPNIFECAYVAVYDKDGGKERQQQRDKESRLNEYLLKCLNLIAADKNKSLSELLQIHRACLSLTIGTVLLALKERVGDKSENTICFLEENIKKMINSI